MPFRKAPSLFDGREASRPEKCLTAHVDGGARGNPGPSGYGVAVEDESGATVAQLSQYLGHQTNNFAEYSGLIAALRFAVENGAPALEVVADSELMVKQMNGIYKVRAPQLLPLWEQARTLSRKLPWFRIRHVRRVHNSVADALANKAMDEGMKR